MILDSQVNNEELLDRICQVYGFTQKIQLARHFNIAASSLQNRYARGTISYDFAVQCALDTGASLRWLMTGQGAQFEGNPAPGDPVAVVTFTLSDGQLEENSTLSIDSHLFSKTAHSRYRSPVEAKLHFVKKWGAINRRAMAGEIEGTISLRDLTLLPGKKLHVAGGKVPFECGIDEIKTLGRVVGIYSEVN